MRQPYTISSSSMSRERTATECRTTLWATYNNEGKASVSFFISNNSYRGIILKISTKLQQFSIIDKQGHCAAMKE
jgi:hypothetical protein